MSATMRPVPTHVNPAAAVLAMPERDAANFDFRTLTLLLVLMTRQDLLKEYLEDGKERNARNVPLAVVDTTKWPKLRALFDPDMLGQLLYLFEIPETQTAALYLRRVFQTMINIDEYDQDTCPGDPVVDAIVTYSRQLTHQLNPAGIADNEGSEN